MVQSYAMAFMIIGSWWEWLKSTSAWIKGISYVLMALFAYVNVWFIYNAHAGQGLYDPSGMTSAYYWAVVGRFHVPEYTAIFKDTEEYFTGKPKDLRKLHALGMDPEGEPVVDCPNPASRKIVVPIQEDWVKKWTLENRLDNKGDWIRARMSLWSGDREWESWKMIQLIIGFSQKGQTIKENMVRFQRFVEPGQTVDYRFDTRIPQKDFDSIYVQIWNPGSRLSLDILDLEIYRFDAP